MLVYILTFGFLLPHQLINTVLNGMIIITGLCQQAFTFLAAVPLAGNHLVGDVVNSYFEHDLVDFVLHGLVVISCIGQQLFPLVAAVPFALNDLLRNFIDRL